MGSGHRRVPATRIADERRAATCSIRQAPPAGQGHQNAPVGTAPRRRRCCCTRRVIYGFDEDAVYLSTAPLYHGALRVAMVIHRLGSAVIFMEHFDASSRSS
jgi:hypothetical protein